MRTSEEIELWKISPVFITRKKEYEKDGEELFQYAEQYIKKQEELEQILPDVVKKLKKEKVVAHCCKKDVPIIIHDLEYTWYMVEATKKANPGMDLSGFLEAVGY